MKTLKDIPVLEGVKVLVRADFNVPVKNGIITDGYRIQSTLPTINYLKGKGAKVVLVSHLESSSGENNSLQPIADHLKKIGQNILFVKDFKKAHEIIEAQMKNGDVILLENLRYFDGEKANDPKFSQELASLVDIYVNDAFSVSHREHASVVGVPKIIPGYAGFQLEKEILNLSKAFNPPHPFLFILGGAKFATKLPLLNKFIQIADMVFVGGALANDLYKDKGYEVGTSLVAKETFDLTLIENSSKLLLPPDSITQERVNKPANGLAKTDAIMDSGPQTIQLLKEKIAESKFILWNGTLGLYEDGYVEGSIELAKLLAEATGRGAETIVGGGDTLAAISSLNLQDKITFISTGGGAMLDFLAQGTLPGIEVLR